MVLFALLWALRLRIFGGVFASLKMMHLTQKQTLKVLVYIGVFKLPYGPSHRNLNNEIILAEPTTTKKPINLEKRNKHTK